MAKARYLMIGGFLGAGKTTAVLRLARHLSDQGKSVGLITNDQSFGLVDTAMARSQGFPVEEITGGCFCCRFDSLVDAADKLSEQSRPDVFIAEPVGSCTDLRAAVSYPLRRIYGDDFEVSALSVVVDPVRASRLLGLDAGRSFSEKVIYVYDRQLAEADFIVINKIAHLKMTLTPDEGVGDIGVLNLVRNDMKTELAHSLKDPLDSGELIINLRAEGDPVKLNAAALAALEAWTTAESGRRTVIRHSEYFRPAKPTPTHRMAIV